MLNAWETLSLFVTAVWWVFFRKKLAWAAVMAFYYGGVFSTDLLLAGLLVFFPHWSSAHLNPPVPGLLMPAAGLLGLVYGAASGKMRKKPLEIPQAPASVAEEQPVA